MVKLQKDFPYITKKKIKIKINTNLSAVKWFYGWERLILSWFLKLIWSPEGFYFLRQSSYNDRTRKKILHVPYEKPYSTLPYLTLTLPYPYPYPYPYPTTLPYPTLLYRTLSLSLHVPLPNPILPYIPLPYHPYPSLAYPSLPYALPYTYT